MDSLKLKTYRSLDEMPGDKMKKIFDLLINSIPINETIETKKLINWFEALREEVINCSRLDSRIWSYLKSRRDVYKEKGLRGTFRKIK
ncbi:MAG: hypothetical protein AB1349_02875 [Elusimicrobiota bacterium]